MYELVYIKDEKEIRSKIYKDREKFIDDFHVFEKSGRPTMGQGPDKNGNFTQVTRNGWNNDDVILTAVVNFGSGTEYSYSASKHYSGMYEVEGKKGNVIVSVKYQWRLYDEYMAFLFEKGYDNPTSFESILVRRVG